MQTKKLSVVLGILLMFLMLFAVSLVASPFILHLFGLMEINSTLFLVSRILYWPCLFVLWLFATKIENQRLLLWKDVNYSLAFYALSIVSIFLLLFAGIICLMTVLQYFNLIHKSLVIEKLISFFYDDKLLLVFTALTAGFVEEIMFRGYLQPRLQIILKNPHLAIVINSLLFGLLHYKYGTIINVLAPTVIGLVFSYYYWKYKNIKVLIFCHFLWDLIALLISMHAHE